MAELEVKNPENESPDLMRKESSDLLPDGGICDDQQEIEASKKEDEEMEMTSADYSQAEKPENVQHEYSYLQREGFTSELFKIEIKNLKAKLTPPILKKFIASKNLKAKKIKLLKLSYEVKAYVTFSCEDDQNRAIAALNGVQWKGCNLLVKKAAPKADPLQIEKRKANETAPDKPAEKKAKIEDDISPEEKLKNSVTPLWSTPYEKQLKTKQENMKQVIRKLGRLIDQNNKDIVKWFMKERKKNEGLCCPLKPVIESPIQHGYRNKCEFTIGRSLDGNDRVVGFRFGKYRGGNSSVGEPDCCRNVPKKMLDIVKHLQNFIQDSAYDVFDPETGFGYWRLLTLRTTVHGHASAMIDFHPQQLSDDQVNEVRNSLKTYFSEQNSGVTSLYFHVNREKTTAANDLQPYELLLGREDMVEVLSGVKFRISPLAFFQINTPAAEILYEQVRNLCSAGPRTTVLDVCCGTGTIGLTMAKNVKKIIGIEMVQSAVNDAIINAKNNDIQNAEFICGKAEDVIPDLMDNLSAEHVVAVVDPPRAGLHLKVIQTLRKTEKLKTIVYVSCNPTAAMNNFVDLCRSESKRMRGSEFVPVKAVAVDLFPDTPHCELVILFERYDKAKHLYGDSSSDLSQSESSKTETSDSNLNASSVIKTETLVTDTSAMKTETSVTDTSTIKTETSENLTDDKN